MKTIRFAKMSGAGNDFIVLDNQQTNLKGVNADFVKKICARRFSVGADGLMLLSASTQTDFTMQYFNADGSEAAMCGNGGRCIARFATLIGAAAKDKKIIFTAPAGRYFARVAGNSVQLSIIPPINYEQDISLKMQPGERKYDFADTGVPHVVFYTKDVAAEEVKEIGSEVRRHEKFQPAGTNVNFCQVIDEHQLLLRTYERGVEDETLACGTGAAAAVLCAARRGWVCSPVKIKTRSGLELEMTFNSNGGKFSDIYQSGEARLIFWGELDEEATAFVLEN